MKTNIKAIVGKDGCSIKIYPDRKIIILESSYSIENRTPVYLLLFKRLLEKEIPQSVIEEIKKNEIVTSTRDGKHHVLHTLLKVSEEAIDAIYHTTKAFQKHKNK